jgi:hypothetical protein
LSATGAAGEAGEAVDRLAAGTLRVVEADADALSDAGLPLAREWAQNLAGEFTAGLHIGYIRSVAICGVSSCRCRGRTPSKWQMA